MGIKMNVLVINCGSSSLKYQLINSDSEFVLASGLCERIGIDGRFTFKPANGEKLVRDAEMKDHKDAIKIVLEALVAQNTGVIKSLDEIGAVGHRVVHGGEKFAKSVIITDEVIEGIKECSDLAPLHNPANLIGIEACKHALPGVPMVAVFDTAFHQTMPVKAYLYGLPIKYYEDYKIRRYGFHGTSHSFVSKRLMKIASLDQNHSKVIVCHLGNGSSISAVVNGKSIDTSMGLTPLEGMPMGTRSGSLDPAIVEMICKKENKTVSEVTNILNKESGVFGLSNGLSSDFRDLAAGKANGNEYAKNAVEVFCYDVAKLVGGYITAMNGVDAIAFTAGVGENDTEVREMILSYFGYLGIQVDKEANKIKGQEGVITTADSKIKVFVVPTNEELAIAHETTALI